MACKSISTTIFFYLLVTDVAVHASTMEPALAPAPALDGAMFVGAINGYVISILNMNILDYNSALICHCNSVDDDLGDHYLRLTESFEWKFRADLFGRTVYSCSFRWGGNTKAFEVFNSDLASKCVPSGFFSPDRCVWVVLQTGFYLNGEKLFDW